MVVFDASRMSRSRDIPEQFLWPSDEIPTPDAAEEELVVPLIDLSGGPAFVVRQVREACELHGFFQVVNHGIDAELVAEAHRCMDAFFALPLREKQRAQRKQGESVGYASSLRGGSPPSCRGRRRSPSATHLLLPLLPLLLRPQPQPLLPLLPLLLQPQPQPQPRGRTSAAP